MSDRAHPVLTEVSLTGDTERGDVVRVNETWEEGFWYLRPTGITEGCLEEVVSLLR